MKRSLVLLICLFLGIAITTVSCKDKKEENTVTGSSLGAEKADLAMNDEYLCPMDCEDGKTYEKPGECPKCKMDLKKVEKEEVKDDNKTKIKN